MGNQIMGAVYRYITKNGIRAVIFWDHHAWVAICLEKDIGTQANSFTVLIDRLEHTVELHEKLGFEANPSPQRYHNMWDSAKKLDGKESVP